MVLRFEILKKIAGECSSVGRASGCGSGGRGFDPHHSPQNLKVSGCGAIGSALALGARGCQFESGHPDQLIKACGLQTAGFFVLSSTPFRPYFLHE